MSNNQSVRVKNLLIGIKGRIAHNLTMYKVTNQEEYNETFLQQCAGILVTYDLPDEVRTDIIHSAMEASRSELESFRSFADLHSFGGSQVTADALIGFHCEELSNLLKEEDSYVNSL